MESVQKNITIEDLKQGSDLLFKQIYENNRDKFLNFARKYNLSHEDNIDVYQDAYIIFYNNVMQGKIEEFTSSISTYLFSIGKYLIFDKMKKNNKTVNKLIVVISNKLFHMIITLNYLAKINPYSNFVTNMVL